MALCCSQIGLHHKPYMSSRFVREPERRGGSGSARAVAGPICQTARPPATPRSGCDSTSTRSEEHTSELQSLMRISYAVFCLKKNKIYRKQNIPLHRNMQ